MSRWPTEENCDPTPKPEKRRPRRSDTGTAIAILSFISALTLHFVFKAGLPLVIVAGGAAIAYILFAREGR